MLSTSQETFSDLIAIVNDPQGLTTKTLSCIRPLTDRIRLVLCLAGTRSSDVAGVSLAGRTPAACRLTPALDAELLVLGRQTHGGAMPRSPAGVVSPVVITRACAGLFAWPITIVDCGVFQQPRTQFITLGDLVAECISTGAAQDRAHVNRLFERGIALGKELARTCDCLVLAECVPGGTTTAYAVLTLLGYKIAGCVSSSLPAGNHEVKQKLVEAGLKRLKLEHPSFQEDPFAALAAMGDPMQAVVAGMTVAAGATVPVLLAGGSQMLAVYALLTAHCPELERTIPKLAVCTTKWVVLDKSADTLRLSQLVKAPLASACIDLSKSQHAALRAYEEGHVKEGCGAGAALLLAALSGAYCEAEIIKAIDVAYDELMD